MSLYKLEQVFILISIALGFTLIKSTRIVNKMRFINLILVIHFFICCAESSSLPSKEVLLTIIHINDFHAHFEEMSRTTAECKEKEKCIGGYGVFC